jgi:hypothetical protein
MSLFRRSRNRDAINAGEWHLFKIPEISAPAGTLGEFTIQAGDVYVIEKVTVSDGSSITDFENLWRSVTNSERVDCTIDVWIGHHTVCFGSGYLVFLPEEQLIRAILSSVADSTYKYSCVVSPGQTDMEILLYGFLSS